jgi:hypothetical protein
MIVTRWTGVEVLLLRTAALRRTQKEFAALSGFSLAAICKWEGRGATITLTGEFAEGMDTLLERLDGQQRARFRSALASVGGRIRPNGPAIGDSDERLQHSLRSPDSVDLLAVDRLRNLLYDLNESYGSEPSTALLAQAGQYLGQVQLFQSYASTETVRRELLAIEAQSAIFMSRLVWDASQRRDNSAANRYLDQAVSVARRIHDPIAEGQALLRQSYVALYGEKDPLVGLSLTTRVAETLQKSSGEIAGVALLHRAEALAMLGRQVDCERALAEADKCFDRMPSIASALGMCSSTERGRLAGSCYLFLGKSKRAQAILEVAAREVRDSSKNRAIILGNLSLAHIRQCALDEGADTLNQAIDIVGETRGGAGLNIVFGACRELRPFRDVPVVQQVYDRVLALMATT